MSHTDPTTLPDPGDLPPGSRLPFGRNALFTGRVRPLLDLADALLHDGASSTLVTQTVQGMGGIGKTQLAAEFAHRYGRFFHGVHWIASAQPDLIGAEIAACGQIMALSPWPQEQPEQIERTLRAWRDGGPRLVILDNLEDLDAARQWLPRLQASTIRLMLTARRSDWPDDLPLAVQRLDLFSPDESLAFLRRTLPAARASDAELEALAERLGHLPLALELAARYLKRLPHLSVPAYLGKLDDLFADPAMDGWRADLGNPTGHDLDLAATFRLSWEQVEDESDRRIFLAAGHCAPNQPVSCELLEKTLQTRRSGILPRLIERLLQSIRPRVNLDEAHSILTTLGLFEIDDPAAGPTTHPLLAEYARTLPGAGEALRALADALGSLTRKANKTHLPSSFIPLRPHAEAAAPVAEAAFFPSALTLWNELGLHRRTVADYPGARAAFERALAICERRRGPDHPDVATLVSSLGLVLQDLGDLAAARAAFERALAIDEAVYGPDDRDVARDVNNLGLVLRDLGDLAGARAAFERALAIDQRTMGSHHPDVAIQIKNLGSVHYALGDLAGARAAFERALGIDEAIYGPDHPNVARGVNGLAIVLKDLGDLDGARAACERAMAINEAVYGPDHPNVARDRNILGSVLWLQGDLAAARAAFERALAIDEAAYGPDHQVVAMDVSGLAVVLKDLGDLAGARAANDRALAICEKQLSPDHPTMATLVNNLGSTLRDQGDLDGARAAYEQALAIFEKQLGPDHPRTRHVRGNLASLDG